LYAKSAKGEVEPLFMYEMCDNKSQVRNLGSVTVPQVYKLLTLAPLTDVTYWNRLIFLLFKVAQTASWWENNQPTWQLRDKWRARMNLVRINPTWKSPGELPIEVVCKKIGDEETWGNPLEGYRYATFDEVLMTIPQGHASFKLLVHKEGYWYTGGGCPLDFSYVSECFRNGSSQTETGHIPVHVAIVKL
jgi:hypothetical protein